MCILCSPTPLMSRIRSSTQLGMMANLHCQHNWRNIYLRRLHRLNWRNVAWVIGRSPSQIENDMLSCSPTARGGTKAHVPELYIFCGCDLYAFNHTCLANPPKNLLKLFFQKILWGSFSRLLHHWSHSQIASDQRSQPITDTSPEILQKELVSGVRLPSDRDRWFWVFRLLSDRPKMFHSGIGNNW